MPRGDVAGPCADRRTAHFVTLRVTGTVNDIWFNLGDLREKGRFLFASQLLGALYSHPGDRRWRSLSKAIPAATIHALKAVVHLDFEALIREYYRDCGGATLSAGTVTPLLRPLKLQQPNHQDASEYDVSCLSLTHMSVGGIGVKHVAESSLPGCRARKRRRGHAEREDQLGSEGCIFGRELKGARKFERLNRAERPFESLYKLLRPAGEFRSKNHSPTHALLCVMATVNMNCVEFYDPKPKPALKASHAQLTRSVLNKHQLPLQPSRSPSVMSAGGVQDNDSFDDSFPSLEELLRPPQNRDIPRVPQNHKNVHISKRQLIDESRMLTDPITPNSVYVPGNTQKEPLIIEDDSDDESDDEVEAGVASSDLLASIEDQDASECGLATQDTASTPSSLFGPFTPQDSEYPNADCFSKDRQQRPFFAELDSTFPVQVRRPSLNCSKPAKTTGQDQIHLGVEKALVDEMRLSLLRERAGGSCDRGGQEGEDEDDIEATSGEDKGPISYCQQINESLQNQRVEDETIAVAPLSQDCEHSVESYHTDNDDNEDNEDDEDEDVRPLRRRKRRHIESDATETATRKKTCTTRGSTGSWSSPADAESTLGAGYQEYPLQGFLKCVRIGQETTYNLDFRLLDLPDSFRPSIGLHISNSTSSGESVGGSAHSRVCASHTKGSPPAVQKQRKRPPLRDRIMSRRGRQSTYSAADDELLVQLKEDDKLPRDEIAKSFPGRTKGTLQVHYSTKLKSRSQTLKYKKRKGTCSSGFSKDLVDQQLRDALPSTPFISATADSTKGAHRSILSTRNKEHTAVVPRYSSQGVESDTDEICEVEALLAKSTVLNVAWYLVKWEGFGDDENTWQEQDDISSDLINDFEASYQGNYLGVQLLQKRERRGKIEYFVKLKGRPAVENSWEKEVTINRERILEFEAV
ncbi:hypothetical protein VE02_05284 [Pseudogymnoascus sp. 03VT05]|nr:hypothetical protein VE02_05284 [Pseudogymnoascus sp. 03VT05]